ncbi:GmrSD restriction endonuclease domain-containing protein [Sphingomonas sp. Leaf339]|uniref:GmrSD restriction endonuclease domain-containing protein n=1 Tax=Sphingomonas sp. Leaf339 TaxID=1736343 RepID=UPI0009E819EA|nr:DUF262 domain-containing protein [Sphingomonas sp. Leaf339]
MRYSNTSVEQFHLGRLVDGIATGKIGIPEFQRDFDWNETDVRSLLATVFAGWPAGSLLLLEGQSDLFMMRAMDAAPPLSKVMFGVLDGQQRLTSLYQSLYGTGESLFAIKWDLAIDQDIEEGIISVRRRLWDRHYGSLENQIKERIIPISALKSPTAFFTWRDDLLSKVLEPNKASELKSLITNLYTYRLSAIHDYEFPVVKLDQEIEPSAIARIFEKVNKTGLTLNTFDLLVAKSFDASWNLRDRWISVREQSVELNSFFGDDGLPLLQAIALLHSNDLRQAAVLDLPKHVIQREWDGVAFAASTIVSFLRANCGVLRRDFMPYLNLLPPFIALAARGKLNTNPDLFKNWFWQAGFSGAYEAAANTRMISHFKAVQNGATRAIEIEGELRIIDFSAVSRKSRRALWATINCAYIMEMEDVVGASLPDDAVYDFEPSTLYSLQEIEEAQQPVFLDGPESEFRGALNTIIVPRRLANLTRKLDSDQTIDIASRGDFGQFVQPQTPFPFGALPDWDNFRAARSVWLTSFMEKKGMKGLNVVVYNQHLDDGWMIKTID